MSHSICTVSLEDILNAKELRRKRQMAIIAQYRQPIISITINMPGNIKDTRATRQLLHYAVAQLQKTVTITAEQRVYLSTGPEAILVVEGSAQDVKRTTTVVEERQSFGRLLDLDVFSADGELISRQTAGAGRKCFVCGEKAVVCMRERRHSQDELLLAVNRLLLDFYAYETRQVDCLAEQIAALAVEAMLYEVACTPAPGLVDRENNGAHRDMDFYTFMASSSALAHAIARCAQAGINHEGKLHLLLPVLRIIGGQGEKNMLKATKGINTHKGLLFSVGIVAAAAGFLVKNNESLYAENILRTVSAIVSGIVQAELANIAQRPSDQLTAGERLYQKYGITGIRGEMEAGLPSVKLALPELRQALSAGLSVNDALLQILLQLIMVVDDTTVMHRHDPAKMRSWVRNKVKQFLDKGGMYADDAKRQIAMLDKEFISHNVSPGGAADLLAVTWFIHRLEEGVEQ